MHKNLIDKIIETKLSNINEYLIKDINFKINKKNELLFFFKPECFLFEDVNYTKSILNMVFHKFKEFHVTISGAIFLKGDKLEESGIMDRHYGYINKLSRNASKIITDLEREKIQHCLVIDNLENYLLVGGHEFLNLFKEFDENSLEKLWITKKSEKLRSGFYVQKYNIKDKKLILVNGFHPAQLMHFTKSSRKIVLLLLHSDTEWKILKNNMVGNTFPEKADSVSIRGELFKNHDKYGAKNVSISNNFVHLSAGPFEALFELKNFLMNLKVVNFKLSLTNIYRLMIENRLNIKDVENCISNPSVNIDNKKIDLFTFTEDNNTLDAISSYVKFFKNNL